MIKHIKPPIQPQYTANSEKQGKNNPYNTMPDIFDLETDLKKQKTRAKKQRTINNVLIIILLLANIFFIIDNIHANKYDLRTIDKKYGSDWFINKQDGLYYFGTPPKLYEAENLKELFNKLP